jgi:hypothetical protein
MLGDVRTVKGCKELAKEEDSYGIRPLIPRNLLIFHHVVSAQNARSTIISYVLHTRVLHSAARRILPVFFDLGHEARLQLLERCLRHALVWILWPRPV